MNCPQCNCPLPDNALFCAQCGAKITPTAPTDDSTHLCSSCGTSLAPDSAFCSNCGASIAKAAVPESMPSVPKKPFAKIKLFLNKRILIAGAAVLLIFVVILVVSSLDIGSSQPVADPYVVYFQDGQLHYTQLPDGGMQTKLTSSLLSGQNADQTWISSFDDTLVYPLVQLNTAGNKLFFPDKAATTSYGWVSVFSLYYMDPGEEDERIRIDSDITSYCINNDGSLVAYLKDGSLYLHNLEEREKVSSDVSGFWFSESGNTLVYLKDESGNSSNRKLYIKYGNAAPERVTANIDSVIYVSPDCSRIIYEKNDSLYVKNGKADPEKVASDFRDYWICLETGTFYYMEKGSDLYAWDFVEDDLAGDTRYDGFRDALKQWSVGFLSSLYYWDGTNTTLISDSVYDKESLSYFYPCFSYRAPKDAKLPSRFLSDVVEIGYDHAYSQVYAEFMDCLRSYICLENQSTELIFNVPTLDTQLALSDDGSRLYIFPDAGYNSTKQGVYCANIKNGKISKATLIAEDVEDCAISNGCFLHIQDKNGSSAALYLDGKQVDRDAYYNPYYTQYDDKTGALYYFTDYNSNSNQATLKCYRNGESFTIKDDVSIHSLTLTSDGILLFLYDVNKQTGEGELWAYDGESTNRLAFDVTTIVWLN